MKIDNLLQMIENAPSIGSVNNVLKMEQYRNEFEIAELLLILTRYKALSKEYYYRMFRLVTDENILKNRTNKEQIKLISIACSQQLKQDIVDLVLLKDLLENFSFEEQVDLLNKRFSDEQELFSDVLAKISSISQLKNYLKYLKNNTNIEDISLNDYVPKLKENN